MSFRGRLTLFFVAIVVVPMIAVAVLVVRITDDSRNGKADARLATGLKTARAIYDEALDAASETVDRVAATTNIGAAMRKPSTGYLRGVARRTAASEDVERVAFFDTGGTRLASAGPADAIAASRRPVRAGGRPSGAIEVAALDPQKFARQVAGLTGTDAVVRSDAGPLAATADTGAAALPADTGGTTLELPSGTVRAAGIDLEGAPAGARLVLLTSSEQGFFASEPLVAAILAAFFGLALVFILLLIRMLQGQIASMLEAARRIGRGDFSGEVPVEGSDEIAGLALEFNKMSDRLSEQMSQLRRQREEIDQSVRRIGEAFASGLDRTALLQIVIETALGACEGECGQIVLRGQPAGENEAEAGGPADEAVSRALDEASARALDEVEAAEASHGGAHALAYPLTRPGDRRAVLGAIAVARRGEPFNEAEREVLRYLMGQAAVSVENIGLHERVAEQAVTDGLTGLANNRHFRDWMERETARLGRFGGELSLVMLDIDNFKQVNDAYGHLQGDEVLEAIGRILRLESRGVDEPARYGGEEFVLALPETPKDGAVEVAERVRERIETTEVAGVDGNAPLRVTASIGVATMPTDGADTQSLLAAADAALYEAKRSGKNRVVPANGR